MGSEWLTRRWVSAALCATAATAGPVAVTATTGWWSTATPPSVSSSFDLHGSRAYRNAESVVFLYDYLLSGARSARRLTVTPSLLASMATVEGSVVGPFRLATTDSAAVRVSDGHAVVDADGTVVTEPLAPGAQFYLRVRAGSGGAN